MASGRSSAASAPVSGGGAPSSAAADSDDEPEQLQYKVCYYVVPRVPFVSVFLLLLLLLICEPLKTCMCSSHICSPPPSLQVRGCCCTTLIK